MKARWITVRNGELVHAPGNKNSHPSSHRFGRSACPDARCNWHGPNKCRDGKIFPRAHELSETVKDADGKDVKKRRVCPGTFVSTGKWHHPAPAEVNVKTKSR